MKHLYKMSTIILLSIGSLVATETEISERYFFSKDRSKSFKGTLKEYSSADKVVTISNQYGNRRKTHLDALSDECQEYIMEHSDYLGIADGLKVEMTKKHDLTKESDLGKYWKYAIDIRNAGDTELDDLTIDYTIYYEEGTYEERNRSKKTPKTKTGSLTISSLPKNGKDSLITDDVLLVNDQKYTTKTVSKGGGGGG